MKSLDPRVNRLNIPDHFQNEVQKEALDQLGTFEVFLIPREGKPLESVGPVHASDSEMAFVFGKEQYSRRFTCIAMAVCPTESIYQTPTSNQGSSAYELVKQKPESEGDLIQFEIFHMPKRGKQHRHVGSVEAFGSIDALFKAKKEWNGECPLNVWVVRSGDFYFNEDEDSDLWDTLPDKKYRDAIFYKAGEKIQKYKDSKS
jgi:ring-1,2-phenylacetyl-CoA epoxidase subunit PaaB